LLITSAAASTADSRQVLYDKHDMSNLLVHGRVGSTWLDAWCHGRRDQCRDGDGGHVQSGGRRERRQCTRSPIRQVRCARYELVQMKHDLYSRKADTVGTSSQASF
jgi:hypothetical protein